MTSTLHYRILVSLLRRLALHVFAAMLICLVGFQSAQAERRDSLDRELSAALARHGFTGNIEARFRHKLNRPIDEKRADLGRLLWFDIIGGLNDDNTCGGCH
ncbi:MAG: Di-heme cytochrome c peroxidase, partial [Bacteroidetes bacterium]|nr:Di-heme cytochrome c peroxidase [Bacteroidota bacterium]